ncbi:SpaA isopeptide-forming pilin-related protein [Companilactobacillus jidongensis]|uniref:SpaA isopeptide-forming pilin-related protein n=1 Tax=Companilactobacillus jidongensis TaxID=2486006 RepID=UPI000F76DFCD|nr:SpaA isopeptide-forming pilin-related protein [Companilactobacillus jidongensis]
MNLITRNKKISAILLLFVFGMSLLANFFATSTTSYAQTLQTLSSSDAKIIAGDGTDVTNIKDLSRYTYLKVNFDWSVPNGTTINDGDTITFELPSNVDAQFSNGVGQPYTIDVMNGAVKVGEATIPYNSHEGTITFNGKLANFNTGVSGTLTLNAKGAIDSSGTGGSGSGGGDDGVYSAKTGWIDRDTSTGVNVTGLPQQLYWNIVLNPHSYTVTNQSLTDNVADDQKILENTMSITAGDNNETVPYTIKYNTDDTEFTITFENTLTKNISITYRTEITNQDDLVLSGDYIWNNYAISTNDNVVNSDGDVMTYAIGSQAANSAIPFGGSATAGGHNGNVTLTKEDTDDTSKVLSGAVFELLNSEGKILNNHLITDSNGKITLNYLDPGKYSLEEITAPDGYKIGTDNIQNFTIADNQSTDQSFTMTDPKADVVVPTGSVTLNKTGSDTKAALAGATFQLEKADGTAVGDPQTTDANGQIKVSDLAYGDYQFVETKAPDNYDKNTTPLTFTIDKDTIDPTVSMVDAKATSGGGTTDSGSVTLIKTGSDTKKALSGATFQLEKADGTIVGDSQTTDSNGQITVNDLAYGDYQFVETKAPDNYKKDATPITFTVDKVNPAQTVKMIDTRITSGGGGGTTTPTDSTGGVTLTKRDASTNEVLQGARFKLLDSKGSEVSGDYITDVNGQLNVAGLKPGKYSFVEITAPEGYGLNSESVEFTIVADKVVNVSMTDEATSKPTTPVSPSNPGVPTEPLTPSQPFTPGNPRIPDTSFDPDQPLIPAVPGTNVGTDTSVPTQGNATSSQTNDSGKLPQTGVAGSNLELYLGIFVLVLAVSGMAYEYVEIKK